MFSAHISRKLYENVRLSGLSAAKRRVFWAGVAGATPALLARRCGHVGHATPDKGDCQMQNEKKSARENTEDRQLAQRVRDEPDLPPTPSEHLQIGMSFAALMEKELADYTREHGDTGE